jgi:hypothetical protein
MKHDLHSDTMPLSVSPTKPGSGMTSTSDMTTSTSNMTTSTSSMTSNSSMTSTSRCNSRSAAEGSVASLLGIGVEDARTLLVEAQRRGLIIEGQSSHLLQVTAAEEVWLDLPLKMQHEIRSNRRHRQEYRAPESSSNNKTSNTTTTHRRDQAGHQQRNAGVAASAAAAATATSSERIFAQVNAGNAVLELLPCLIECLVAPLFSG